jgi:hypothetical protein
MIDGAPALAGLVLGLPAEAGGCMTLPGHSCFIGA